MIMTWLARINRKNAERDLNSIKNDYETVTRERDNARAELRKVKDELEDLKLKKTWEGQPW